MKYKNIKWILKKQIEINSQKRWVWLEKSNEFICVYHLIPKEADELYTPEQLLNKRNKKDAEIAQE